MISPAKIKDLIVRIKGIEHGFKHIIAAGDVILGDRTGNHLGMATAFFQDESYQVRMLAVYLLGQLSVTEPEALEKLEKEVSFDANWRVQEMLAKAFDHYCAKTGYEKALPVIKKWLANEHPPVKRAVIEGLRVWTARPFFKTHPAVAVKLIAAQRNASDRYLLKSVGNALHDIRKKYPDEVAAEMASWSPDEVAHLVMRE